MAHKTLVNGTAYEISGGRALVNGTGYNVKSGRTLVNGTGYDIDISKLPPVGTSLNNMTWEEVRAVSDAGLAASYFSIGDRKAVTLNGTVGKLTFSNETYYCYIIGIDHNSAIEGANRIHFQFGYSALSGGKQIAFIDSVYGSYNTSEVIFSMNISKSSKGGWKDSRMRTTICPAFANAMPSDLKAVLKPVTKYTDNYGDGYGVGSTPVTATIDTVFILSECELVGSKAGYNSGYFCNDMEKQYQAQYAYYSSGVSLYRYKHNSTGNVCYWWLRSVYANGKGIFCGVSSDYNGSITIFDAALSYGFTPAFCV